MEIQRGIPPNLKGLFDSRLVQTKFDTFFCGKQVNIEFYHEHGEWELQDTKDELEDFDICCPDETVQKNIITLQVNINTVELQWLEH